MSLRISDVVSINEAHTQLAELADEVLDAGTEKVRFT